MLCRIDKKMKGDHKRMSDKFVFFYKVKLDGLTFFVLMLMDQWKFSV